MTPDLFNGLFEFLGAGFVCLNIRKILEDRAVRGMHWASTAFFSAWGLWNLYYYPSLDQWWSFAGGIAIVGVNLMWLILVWVYWRR